jgi:hypothetical protein
VKKRWRKSEKTLEKMNVIHHGIMAGNLMINSEGGYHQDDQGFYNECSLSGDG